MSNKDPFIFFVIALAIGLLATIFGAIALILFHFKWLLLGGEITEATAILWLWGYAEGEWHHAEEMVKAIDDLADLYKDEHIDTHM